MLGDAQIAIEVKSSSRIDHHDLKGLRDFANEFPQVQRRILLCLDPMARSTEDGIEIIPVETFLPQLWGPKSL